MKKIIILVFTVFSILILNINYAHATLIYEPGITNIVVEVDFNYPETNYIYYGYDVLNFEDYSSMGMHIYNNVNRRYGFINYLWAEKDSLAWSGSGRSFIADIYLPKQRLLNGISYNLDWGIFSYDAFDTVSPISFDSTLGNDYVAIKFVHIDYPLEDREVLRMYIINNVGQFYSPDFYGSSLEYVEFVREYNEDPISDINLFVNINESDNDYNHGYGDGYGDARREYGYYDGTDYITADEWADKRYNDGLGQNRNYYGYLHNGNWLTAEEWADIRYDAGYDAGLSDEIDWFSWATTFFLMPFKILNIQILPGIRIGYFALFSLLLGVVGWFFFIVGKGGGRRK